MSPGASPALLTASTQKITAEVDVVNATGDSGSPSAGHGPTRRDFLVGAGGAMVGLLVAGCTSSKSTAPKQSKRKNILLLVLDDVGYAEVPMLGGEIPTPAISSLAKSGTTFVDFHSSPSCSPTRDMYLTGVDNHQAGLGNMVETLLPQQMGHPGYEGVLNKRVVTIAENLRENGYHTYMVGKWHLGGGAEDPYNRGFEETYIVLQGLAGHFMVQPAYPGDGTTYTQNGKVVPPPNGQFDAVHDTTMLINMIDSNKADGKPWFAHWAIRMAHDPLQAPADLIAEFKGNYDSGYEVLRQERVDRMKKLGLIPQDAEMARREAMVEPWDDLSADDKAFQSRLMEVYAAMITAADQQIGRLMDHLHAVGEYDNTEILVLADNGPNAETIEFYGAAEINKMYDNSTENIGNANSFEMYGPGWAQAGAGPFRLYKGFESEGGTRTVFIASGQAMGRAGQKATGYVSALDIFPTILDLAHVTHPTTFGGHPVLPLVGTSILPFLNGSQSSVHPADQPLGAEMWGRAALRKGNYKILWVGPPFGSGKWELYDLTTDVAESNDLSTEQPDVFNEMMADFDAYVKDNGIVLALGNGIGDPSADEKLIGDAEK